MNLYKYPMDEQTCSLYLQSCKYDKLLSSSSYTLILSITTKMSKKIQLFNTVLGFSIDLIIYIRNIRLEIR
jgi:hypothetical protein